MAVGAMERCKRCGTKIRNERTVCPSCGLDLTAPAPAAAPIPVAEPAAETPAVKKRVNAKAGVKICQVCMASVPEEQVVELDNQKLCPTCAERMQSKAVKKSAPPPKDGKK